MHDYIIEILIDSGGDAETDDGKTTGIPGTLKSSGTDVNIYISKMQLTKKMTGTRMSRKGGFI